MNRWKIDQAARWPSRLHMVALILAVALLTSCTSASPAGTAADANVPSATNASAETPNESPVTEAGPAGEASEASEQQPVYFDMIVAYENGNLDEARTLARTHLERNQEAAAHIVSDLDREGVVRRTLGILDAMLAEENKLDKTKRLGGDTELVLYVQEQLHFAQELAGPDLQVPDAVLTFIQHETGQVAASWIRASSEIVAPKELQTFYESFETELRSIGLTNLEEIISVPVSSQSRTTQATGPILSDTEEAQLMVVIQNYFTALINGDVGLLQAATDLDANAVEELIAPVARDYAEENITQINRIDIPEQSRPLPLVSVSEGSIYRLKVKGISLEVTLSNGSAVTQTIDKLVTVGKKETGQWFVIPPQQ